MQQLNNVHTDVLVIDDSPEIGKAMEKADGMIPGVKIRYANDFKPGLAILRANPQITVVVLDVHLHRYHSITDGYVKQLREEFNGTLIGASVNERFDSEMLRAGCDRFIHKGDDKKDKLLEFLDGLPNASATLIYKSPYVDRWRKMIATSMLLVVPSSIDEMMGIVNLKGERLKLVVLREEELVPPDPEKGDSLAQTYGDPFLLEKMRKAGFSGTAILTRMRERPQVPASVLNDEKVVMVHRPEVEDYLRKHYSTKDVV